MTDAGRKDFSTQAKEKLTPESQKSTTDKATEGATGLYDRAAGALQPDDSKSGGQKLFDSGRSGKDDAENQGKSVLDTATDTINSGVASVKNTLSGNTK